MFTQKQIEDLVDLLITLDSNTKIYLGCDSVRYVKDNRWSARYATVAIVHKNGNNGCRIFSHNSVEPDYDLKKNRPKMRMMNEVMKVCSLYTQIAPFIDESYDNELDPELRFKMIMAEIERLSKMDINEIHNWYKTIFNSILLHNQNVLFSNADYMLNAGNVKEQFKKLFYDNTTL